MSKRVFMLLVLTVLMLPLTVSCSNRNIEDNKEDVELSVKSSLIPTEVEITLVSEDSNKSITPAKKIILTDDFYNSKFSSKSLEDFLESLWLITEFKTDSFENIEMIDSSIVLHAKRHFRSNDKDGIWKISKEDVSEEAKVSYNGITLNLQETKNFILKDNDYIVIESTLDKLSEENPYYLSLRDLYLNDNGTYSALIEAFSLNDTDKKLVFIKTAILNIIETEESYLKFDLIQYTNKDILGSISAIIPTENIELPKSEKELLELEVVKPEETQDNVKTDDSQTDYSYMYSLIEDSYPLPMVDKNVIPYDYIESNEDIFNVKYGFDTPSLGSIGSDLYLAESYIEQLEKAGFVESEYSNDDSIGTWIYEYEFGVEACVNIYYDSINRITTFEMYRNS